MPTTARRSIGRPRRIRASVGRPARSVSRPHAAAATRPSPGDTYRACCLQAPPRHPDAGSGRARAGRTHGRTPASNPTVAVRMAGVTRRFNGTEAVSGLDLEIPAGSVIGRHRPVRLGQDDDDPDDDRLARPDGGRRSRCSARAAGTLPPRHARADRLHAPAVQPVPRPHGRRERRLRGGHVRAHVLAPLAAHAQGAPAASTCGRSGAAARASSPAACGAASSSRPPSSTSRTCSSSTSRRRASTRSSGAPSGTRSTASATAASPRS